jgi:hypothetical protein
MFSKKYYCWGVSGGFSPIGRYSPDGTIAGNCLKLRVNGQDVKNGTMFASKLHE